MEAAAKAKENSKPDPKPKKEAPKKKEPKPAPKKTAPNKTTAAVGAGAVAASAKAKPKNPKPTPKTTPKPAPKKSAIHKEAKVVKPKQKNADIHAALDAAALKQNPTTTSVHEHHDWNLHDPGVHKEIAKEYPVGVTEEVYMKGKKEITERVVVKDGKGDIYWKVKHPWGGVYYFKNSSIPISAVEFDLYTTIKDDKGQIIPPYHIDRVGDH